MTSATFLLERGPDRVALEEGELEAARERFFPGWWAYPGDSEAAYRPLYRVVCRTDDDWRLAQAAKPEGVDADFVFEDAPSED